MLQLSSQNESELDDIVLVTAAMTG